MRALFEGCVSLGGCGVGDETAKKKKIITMCKPRRDRIQDFPLVLSLIEARLKKKKKIGNGRRNPMHGLYEEVAT